MGLQVAVAKPSGAQSAQEASGRATKSLRAPEPIEARAGAPAALINWDFAKIPLFARPSGLRIQPQLRIGGVNDPLEHEADQVADRVMRMSDPETAAGPISRDASPRLQRKCDCGGTCDKCQGEQSSAGPVTLQMKSAGGDRYVGTPAPASVNEVLRSPGQPLEPSTRTFMERRFSHDFSRVRVHPGLAADASAREIGAQAYTAGPNIVFAEGQYAPSEASGRHLIAHELAHVVQQAGGTGSPSLVQRSARVAGCGLLNLAGSITDIGSAAHIQIQGYLAGRGISDELPIPRATKRELGWGCRKAGTEWGFADLSRGGPAGLELAEIKPISAKALAKLEVGHYRRRAAQSLQRLFKVKGACARRPAGADDIFFGGSNGLTPASGFSLLSGVLSGDETIGPFSGDPSLILKAKQAGPGAVGYWCTKDKSKQQQQPKPPGPSVGLGVAVGGSAGGAYNAGVGISIMSDSTAYGTAGAGVSYKSDTKSAGVAGVGASVESDSLAAGAAGAGASKDTQSAGAGIAGAGTSSGSVSAGAGVAGAGSSTDSATAAAGVAGKGSVKDSAVAAAGSSGSGKLDTVEGAGTGSPGKPVDAKDQLGGGKSATPAAEGADSKAGDQQQGSPTQAPGTGTAGKPGAEGTGAGTGSGAGARAGAGAGPGKGSAPDSAAAKGAQGAKDAGPDPGTGGTGAGPSSQGTGGTGTSGGASGASAGGSLGVGPVLGPGASDADRQKAAEEASKVAARIANASAAQIALLRYLAQTSPNGQYVVPTSEWVDTMMKATEGLSEEDIKYLQSLNWKPAKITPEELRKKIQDLLKTKKPPASADSAKGGSESKNKSAAPPAQEGSGGKGTSATKGQTGAGAGAKGPSGSGPGAFVQGHRYTGSLTGVDQAGFQIQPDKAITPNTRKGAKATLEVRFREDGVVKRAKVEYEIIADPVLDTNPNTKKQVWRFDLQSTNDDPITLSPEGAAKPTVVPAHAPASYYIEKK